MSARLAFYLTPADERRKLQEFIRENFILLDVDGYAPGGSKEEYDWWLKVQGRKPGDGCGANAWYVATAGGTRLADPSPRDLPNLRKVRAAWLPLAESDRKPALSKAVQDNPKHARLTPPPGALILRVYFSFLDDRGAEDPTPVKQTRWYTHIIESRLPGTDVLWVTEKEWKSMIPADPKKGDKLDFPATLQHRILKFYTAPELIGWNNTAYGEVREAGFSMTVDEASDRGFRLRLEGFARKGKVFKEKEIAPMGGDFRFLGYLSYNAARKAFDRIDVVALGKGWGGGGEPINGTGKGPFVEYVPVYEQTLRPYGVGIAWELVSGERAVDRVPPGPGHNGYPGWAPQEYFGRQ
jgi:hypothetical protein